MYIFTYANIYNYICAHSMKVTSPEWPVHKYAKTNGDIFLSL
jgi:hypothetical protein